jgi:Protein of unknown function (DUF4238)
MTRDHFIAQTYLKRWCDPAKRPPLQAYRKSNVKPFRCSPRDVCHEWDGDLIRAYFTDPALLGKFRNIFEPKWNPTIEKIGGVTFNQEDKLILSMAWAHFSLCTPAQRELAKVIYRNEARALASELVEGHRLDPSSLTIEIEREADFFKRLATKYIPLMTSFFYNQDWRILRNDTESSFITSDNPSAFAAGSNPRVRLLPISPSLCLYTQYAEIDMRLDAGYFDFGLPPKGSIDLIDISKRDAMKINRFTVMNAADFVFSRHEYVGIAAFVKKYGDFRPQVEPVSFPIDDAGLKSATLTITPRRCE